MWDANMYNLDTHPFDSRDSTTPTRYHLHLHSHHEQHNAASLGSGSPTLCVNCRQYSGAAGKIHVVKACIRYGWT